MIGYIEGDAGCGECTGDAGVTAGVAGTAGTGTTGTTGIIGLGTIGVGFRIWPGAKIGQIGSEPTAGIAYSFDPHLGHARI